MMLEINKIYNEDCLETMGNMPDGFVDLTVTSPPYDDLRTYNGYSFDFDMVAQELFRITKDGGVVVWVVGDTTKNFCESLSSFRQAIYFVKECGFRLHDTMIYRKNNPIPLTHNRYEQCFEYMFVFSKNKPKTFNPILIPTKTAGTVLNNRSFWQDSSSKRTEAHKNEPVKKTKYKYNIWDFTVGATKGKKHPAPFPDLLASDHILSWSNEGDLVYDPFIGSGTTARMAIINNRKWIGSEISKDYCEIAKQRILSIIH